MDKFQTNVTCYLSVKKSIIDNFFRRSHKSDNETHELN